MTTIVSHRKTGNQYILLGINGDANKTNPSRFISEFFAQDKAEISYSATVCDVQGNLFLAYIDDLIVVEIDGKKPADILPKPDLVVVERDVYPLEEQEEGEFDEEFDEDDDELEPVNKIKTTDDLIDEPQKPDSSDRHNEEEDWI